VEIQDVRYAKSGDVNIAYQVTGDGPFDLVFVPGYVTHLELHWAIPTFAPFLDRLSSFARLIRFDKRGTGMSDRVSGAPTLETRMDDVRAVMDAVGSRRAAVYGLSEGAAMSLLFAATYPERTAALVIRSAFPRRMWAADYPWGQSEDEYQREVNRALRVFGPREQAREAVRALGRFTDEEAESFLQMLRFGASPGALEALHRMNKEIDVRHVLPAVRVPTLILHGSEDTIVPLEVAHYIASQIPTGRVVEIAGIGHLAFYGGGERIAEEIEEFLNEVWEAGGWEEGEPDRVLATVLFTDIVGSTAKAAELGDRAWRELLARHHALIRLSSFASEAQSSTLPVTASSPALTARLAPSAVRVQSPKASGSWDSRSEQACTRVSARSWTGRSAASPCTSERGLQKRRGRARCLSRARSRIWWPVRASASANAGQQR
jgi:pimeloyl-ACP methyl ester carboxylesterase